MIKNKGFTLVELLATIVVIGVIILISVPNMIGIINKNKDSNYIDDARRMQSLAEYKFRSEDKDKLNSNSCLTYTLNELNKNQEFDKTPDDSDSSGKKYDFEKSFVVVKKDGSEYKYYVFLMTATDERNESKKYANFDDRYNLVTGDDDSKKYKSVIFEATSSDVCSKP